MATPIKNLVPARVNLVLPDRDREIIGDLQDLLAAERRGPVTISETIRDALRFQHESKLPALRRPGKVNGR